MRLSVFTAFLVLLCSCQKNDNKVADPSKVTISIIAPVDGQTYKSNDTVYINGKVSYPDLIHGFELMIIDTATGFVVYDDAQHVHTDHIDINDKWTTSVSKQATYKILVISSINHNGDTASKELYITIKP